ncbi:MAG TPA: glycosyl hydrolase [Gemmatimonadaceae bacterium]|nr:glycosyl hydrolase [Gemmatimonadaceae bacterium]
MFTARRALLLACLPLTLPAASGAPAPAPVPPSQLTAALRWRSVGPYTGGRVTTVAGIPDQPNVFFMGTAGGGVWKTDDYGDHWTSVSDRDFKTGNIGAMAIAPSDPNVIYVGTGDSAPRNTVLTGEGMYKSTDGGKHWTYIGLGDTHIITWVLVDPTNPDVVYVTALGHLFAPNAERGVYKTTDGGKTWKKILFVNDSTGAYSLTMDPSNPNVLYASMWQMSRRHWTFSSGGPGSGIYKSTDGGATWHDITHASGLPTGIFGKVGLAVAPSSPSTVYALIQATYKDQAGGLFRSDDAGQTWRLINNSMDITQRAFYYGNVFVDPKDANTIYLPNVGVYVSHDGGKTLSPLRPAHGDNHVLWINPNNPQIFIEGNDGGAGVTLNGGKTFSSEDNQPTGQFYHANLDDQFPFHIYGAQQDRSSVEAPSAVPAGSIPPVWRNIQGGEMSWVVPTPGRPWITYGSGYYSMEWREDRRAGLVTNVAPWPEYKFGLQGTEIKYRYGWNHHPVVFASHNPRELLMGANVLFETTDEGLHWKTISPDLTRNDTTKEQRPGGPISADVTGEEMFGTLSSIAFSPLSDDVIWTGSDDGLVHVTTDGGAHWREVRPPALPTWSTVTCIEPSHTDKGTAYLSASRYDWDDFHPYVYKTTDYGKHWTAISTGLPDDQYVESVRQDPNDPSLLFAGTSATAYFSQDDGASWQPLTLNLPAVRVNDIEIQPRQHAVVLATFGRGFYVLDDLQFLEQLKASSVTSNAAHVFKPQQAWLVTRRAGGFGGAGAGGANLAPGVTVFFHLPADYDGSTPATLSFTTTSGTVIRSFALHPKAGAHAGAPSRSPSAARADAEARLTAVAPGMNRFQWDLRYPTAVDVKGIFNSGFSAGVPVGPEVVPGTYDVTLTYGGTTQKRAFVVKLDPRLQTTQAQLEQRFALLMRLHGAVGQLDSTLNSAIDARDSLQSAAANGKTLDGRTQAALDKLNRDIDDLVDLKIQSGEGALVYPGRLRSWLSAIAGQVEMAYVAPTRSMTQVANGYIKDAGAGVGRLKADIAATRSIVP